jgi:hypothetical protein
MALANLNTADFIQGSGVSQTGNVIDVTGGGGGGVESVTGDGVDNTDPLNPVLTFPTPGDIGALATGTAWLLASGGALTGHNTISGNFDKYFTGTGSFVVGHNVVSESARFQVRGIGTTTNPLALFEDSAGTKRISILDNGTLQFFNTSNQIVFVGSTNNTTITHTPGSATRVYTIPDVTSTQFVMGAGVQTIANAKTFSTRIIAQLGVEFGSGGGSSNSFITASGGAMTISSHSGNGGVTVTSPAGGATSTGTQFLLSCSGTLSTSSSSVIRTSLRINPTYENVSQTGSNHFGIVNNAVINYTAGTTTLIGFDYNPSFTSATGLTHIAIQHRSGYVSWNSVLSPAQITSNQNDYNPTGFNNGGAPYGASILRLSTDASRDITGLVGGLSGRLLIIQNVGTNNIVLKHEDAGSTAANRFAIGADLTLAADEGLMLWYDNTTQRWRKLK